MTKKYVPKWCRSLGALALVGLLISCGSPAGDDGTTESGDATANQQNNPNQAGSCVATPSGALVTSVGDISYDGGTLTSSAKHLPTEGCVTELVLGFAKDEGCSLNLTLREIGGAWNLVEGSFSLDGACGLVGTHSLGEYKLKPATAVAALVEAPTLAAESTCLDANKLGLIGQGEFVLAGESITLTLDQLSLSGETASEVADSGACPEMAVPCQDMVCGVDEYGMACGGCDLGHICQEGACEVEGCPPVGPYGTEPYKMLTDLEIFDCDGNPVHLHELCGAPAGFFNLLAGW